MGSTLAGLLIHELDERRAVLVTHPKEELTKASDYVWLQTTFVAQPNTRTVRFTLGTVIACRYDQGSVTYDDCELSVAR